MTFDEFMLPSVEVSCILNLPTSRSAGVSYGSLDHGDHTADNTKNYGKAELAQDGSWGLLHKSGVGTYWHHDSDGKMTIVNGVTGAKIWTLFMPDPSLLEEQVRDI
ncbi:hypothetical protein PM082_018185 [Marasmius tenuissimus]|nr:hypothetical protein PM082_018185 [Marasmius tenuissimus]